MDGEQAARDEISDETREMVIRIRERAAQTPGAPEIGAMLTSAAAKGTEMTAEQIRVLAADALSQAEQVSFLLGKLAGMLDEPDEEQR